MDVWVQYTKALADIGLPYTLVHRHSQCHSDIYFLTKVSHTLDMLFLLLPATFSLPASSPCFPPEKKCHKTLTLLAPRPSLRLSYIGAVGYIKHTTKRRNRDYGPHCIVLVVR